MLKNGSTENKGKYPEGHEVAEFTPPEPPHEALTDLQKKQLKWALGVWFVALIALGLLFLIG